MDAENMSQVLLKIAITTPITFRSIWL